MTLLALVVLSTPQATPTWSVRINESSFVSELPGSGNRAIRIQRGAKTVDLLLDDYWKARAKARDPKSPDKRLNDLAYMMSRGGVVESVQWLAVTRTKALGIITYVAAFMSHPHFDGADELVMLDISVPSPKVTPIRWLTPTLAQHPVGPRLFWSKRNLLLRNPDGFEVIKAQTGEQAGFVPLKGISTYVGQVGFQLILSPNASWKTEPRLTTFDLAKQTSKTQIYEVPIESPYVTNGMTASHNIEMSVEGTETTGTRTRQVGWKLLIDPLTLKVLRRTRTLHD